jgi:CHAD domain-containing protein
VALTFSMRASIEELWSSRGAEVAHARQVAHTAVRLFDSLREALDLPAALRDRLEAACLLHDIGYAGDQRRHGEAGAAIVGSHGVEGMTGEDVEWVANLVRLHPAHVTPAQAGEPGSSSREPRLLRLEAILRIADALDYSHLQDVTVASARAHGSGIVILVREGASSGCAARAAGLAGPWACVLPGRLTIRASRAAGCEPVVRPSLNVLEGVQRLLFPPFRRMQENVRGSLSGSDDEALHELRVAIRQMRAVLKAFRRPLRKTSASRVEEDLGRLNRILGGARDLDVWLGFVEGGPASGPLRKHRLWSGFVNHQKGMRQLQQATVRRHLRGPAFAALQLRIARLLRVEIPTLAAATEAAPFRRAARKAFAKALGRALGSGRLRKSHDADELHRLRIALRRVRYLAAQLGPVLEDGDRKLGRRAHAVERRLGSMRDAEMFLARILDEGPQPPRQFVEALRRMREKGASGLEQAWARFSG